MKNTQKLIMRNKRQTYLLSYFWENFWKGIGVSNLHAPPYSTFIGCNPGGLGMANIRGLQRRGAIHEPAKGIFYLTHDGVLECEAIFMRYKNDPKRLAAQKKSS